LDKRTKREGCNHKKNVIVTMGDPGGVGPELALSLFKTSIYHKINILLVGVPSIFSDAKDLSGVKLDFNIINSSGKFISSKINILDIGYSGSFTKNYTSANNGEAAYLSIREGINICIQKRGDAIVTTPISKEGLKLAGINFPGHTEILAHFTNTEKYRMLFISKYFNVILHTIHIPLKDVPYKIFDLNLEDTILLGNNFLIESMKVDNPLIFVAGVNPHSGENGLFGEEESIYITPIIEKLKSQNINVKGPFPPDTLFFKALEYKPDLIVAMYHDQGLIPIKMTDFFGAVNLTVGLPFIRTSPDHGTAFDIAWRKNSDINLQSMLNAVRYAEKLS